jgi:cephalosporin hydroxylase
MEGLINEDKLKREYYYYVHTSLNGRREPRWKGTRVVKFPQDLILYSQVIQKRKPDFIIETGTAYGGSSMFFADMLRLVGNGRVVTIDVSHSNGRYGDLKKQEGITYLLGSSVDAGIIAQVKEIVGKGSVMVVLDSDHSTNHVYKEMNAYAKIVTPGQYMVVEDCWTRHETPYHPWYAVDKFLKERTDFRRFDLEKQFIFAVTRDGWLRRIR